MENRINIVELLKDCPRGMKLYSPIFGDVYLDKIRPYLAIVVTTDKEQGDFKEEFLYDGRYGMNGECMLFPSKGKTTWEGFQRPITIKDGDIVFYNDTIAIFKEWGDKTLFRTYVTKYLCCDSLIDMNVPLFGKSVRKEIRFATEEEKQKLFDAIKANGYKWNAETKTLEKLVESKEDTNDKVVMSGIYFDREYYADEVELHLGNYEIEIRDGKTYAIFKNQETMEKLNKPEFKAGDRIKDTRNNSEGIIEKIDKENCTCLFDYGRFYFPITELDNFELVPNKSDITSKQSYMEEINVDWCKQHGMTLSQVNVASDTSYYLETNGYTILVYTISTTGNQKLNVINPITNKEIEFSLSRLNKDLNKFNSITTDDLRKLCELVNLDYPFKS